MQSNNIDPDELLERAKHTLTAIEMHSERKDKLKALMYVFDERAVAIQAAERRGVAWAIKHIDQMHINNAQDGTADRLFKGIKNTMRDRYKAETGVDPAPNYPIKAELQSQLPKKEES